MDGRANPLDWAVNEQCEGDPVLVRYADDFGSPILLPPLVPYTAASVPWAAASAVGGGKALAKWLARRNRDNGLNWQQFASVLRAFPLTPARVVHSYL